jgi:hypothetical protein
MKKRKLIVLITGMVIAAGIFYAWNEYHRGHVNTKDVRPFAVKQAAELVKEFEEDEAAANRMYGDKVVSVAGKIVKTEMSDSTRNILLAGESAMAGVLCQFETVDNSGAEVLKTGDLVKIKGVCTGILMDVVLTRCSLDK